MQVKNPGAPQDEAGLTRKFETSHVGGATGRTPPIPRSALDTTGISAFPLGWPWEAQSSPRVARERESWGGARFTAGPKRPHLSKNTTVGCHYLLQRIFPTQEANLHWQVGSLPLNHLGSPQEEYSLTSNLLHPQSKNLSVC